MPDRITLSRAKGWRMPPNTVKVDRSTRWGNPFRVGQTVHSGTGREATQEDIATQADAVRAFADMLQLDLRNYPSTEDIRTHLRGKTLACWCKPGDPCHADILLQVANA